MTHPLGDKFDLDPGERGNNVANAARWVKWLVENTPWSVNAAWMTNVMAVDEELLRPRILIDQLIQMIRCDALVLVGGAVSPHMRVKNAMASRRGLPVIDATELGYLVPVEQRPVGHITWLSWLLSKATKPIVPLVQL